MKPSCNETIILPIRHQLTTKGANYDEGELQRWLAESVWLQRLQMAEHVIIPSEKLVGNIQNMCIEWIKCSEGIHEFTKKTYDERGFEHAFHYSNIKGDQMKSKVWECLHHVCNHSSFHRGQLINYLRQVGVTSIPSTDFITFCRKK